MVESLSKTIVQPALTTRWLGHSYYYLESVGSTNDWLKKMAAAQDAQALPAGTVVLANFQSRGRGRLDRRWEAPPATSLLLSVLFRPHWPAKQSQWLTMVAGLAAAEAIESQSGLSMGLKWPNDLVVRHKDLWHKTGGILLEGELDENGRLQSTILGIGINVNIPQDHLPQTMSPATSLLVASGKTMSRLAILVDFLQRLEHYYEAADGGQSPQPAWNQQLITIGQPVQVTKVDENIPLRGLAEGTNDYGQLLVRDDSGQIHTVTAGDVTLRIE